MITLKLPTGLVLGARPYNIVTALYHYAMSDGSFTVEQYSSEWGWSILETYTFIQNNLAADATQPTLEIEWHNSCKLRINYNNMYTSNLISSITSGVGVHENLNSKKENTKTLVLDETSFEIEQNTDEKLWSHVQESEEVQQLLECWVILHKQAGYSTNTLTARDLSAASSAIYDGNADKALAVLEWLFTSEHYRAAYLRKNKMIRPAVVISRAKIGSNYALSQDSSNNTAQDTNNPKTTPSLLSFDEQGNLIEE